MEFLKVFVVLIVVLQGSLSKPVSSNKDELSVLVGKLERLASRLRQHAVDESRPGYSMGGIGPLSGSTSEFPLPAGTSPLSPWGLDNDELDPSSPTYQWLNTILKPYFRSFPSGTYTSEMPLTPRNIVAMLNTWYNNADQTIRKEQTFFTVARQLLDARFQCVTTRINQIVFYAIGEQARVMAENDWKIDTNVRKVLVNWILDTNVMDNVAQKIVKAAHRHAYGDIMEHVQYFQLNDIVKFLSNMKLLMWKAEQEKWTPVMFDKKLNQLLTNSGLVFQCPSIRDLWEFHQEIVSRIQERLSETKPFTDTEAWLQKVLPTYMTTDATPVITAVLNLYTDYVKSAMLRFQRLENHVTSGNAADITSFMSQLLAPHQLQYLQSIFEFLNTGNVGDTMEMGQVRKENPGNGSSVGRCTNGECR